AALAAAVAERLLGPVGLPVSIVVMVFALSLFGEVLPMTLAVEHPELCIGWVNRPVTWLSIAVTPIRMILGAFTALTLRLVGSERKDDVPEISEEELRTLVDVGAREGVVERTEREMIHRVFELEDTVVREVMVPRPDMFCLEVATPPDRLLDLLRENLHSRVPVYEATVDQIVGVLYTKEVLTYFRGLPPALALRPHRRRRALGSQRVLRHGGRLGPRPLRPRAQQGREGGDRRVRGNGGGGRAQRRGLGPG